MDIPVPASPVIMALVERYPPGSLVYLTRKGVAAGYNLQPLVSGGFTGTFSAGDRRSAARVTAKVYDKQWERLNRAGIVIGPLTRYETTIRKRCGATLHDASDPAPIFWHFADPALLSAPPGQAPWVPFTGDQWSPGARPAITDYARLARRVDASVDLEGLLAMADSFPGGRVALMRLLQRRIGARASETPLVAMA
jgi:hypothetical protein